MRENSGTDYRLDDWRITCPSCAAGHAAISGDHASCAVCGQTISSVNGVWQLMTRDRADYYREFLASYTKVRIAEERASYTAATLRALPFCPASHTLAGQWKIRAISFTSLMLLLKERLQAYDKILDLGAGTGWLSHRLALEGFSPCAIDLSTDAYDGLGAARHFDTQWPRLQAEYDRIPIADDHVSTVIFNASFHYCTSQELSIREALRVLVPGGLLIIVDSPIYKDRTSGEQMLEEQQEYFERLIGERSDALPSSGFLTWTRLAELADDFSLDWHVERPWYGFRWAVRPLLAKLRGQREPATFAIVWAYKSSSAQTD